MYEIAKLKTARRYMLAMAEGVNPCTREFAPETDVIAIPSVQEQCEYVMCILDELIEIEVSHRKKRKRETPKSYYGELPTDIIELSDEPIGPAKLAKKINVILGSNTTRIDGIKINDFMVEAGYLDIETIGRRKRKKLNDKSESIGLSSSWSKTYNTDRIFYSKKAQEFVVKNLSNILKRRKKQDE